MKRVLVNLDKIVKQYGSRKILNDFSYSFYENGFYLLFGESGCGKTTLLNILAGMTEFESGCISITNKQFHKCVDWNQICDLVGYVTQNSFFIDYLTIGEQLELTGCEKSDIPIFLAKFNMLEYEHKYPRQLSGGEKQRLSIVQALLQNKKILLLDEPTASLDEENKLLVFNALSTVSKKVLVICSSHDDCAKRYADSIIDFTKLNENNAESHSKFLNHNNESDVVSERRAGVSLYPYFKKWFSYSGRERKSTIGIYLIYFATFIAVFLGDIPSHKLSESIEHVYKINQCAVTVEDYGKQLFEILDGTENVLDVGMVYNGCAPDITIYGEAHDTLIYGVLPLNSDAFALKDRIEFGSYFNSSDQVILSANKAAEYGEPSEIIGHTITLNTYEGYRKFEIAGVFETFSDTDIQYLRQGINMYANDCIYINTGYTQQFQEDKNFNWLNRRTYVVYFSDYKSMCEFKDKASTLGIRVAEDQIANDITEQFSILFYVLMPLTIIIMICSILFYYQTRQIELSYNKHLLLIYDYLGFDKHEIKKCFLRGFFTENLRILSITLIFALIFCFIVNFINEYFQLVAFRIFTFSPIFILSYLFFNILFSLFASYLFVLKLNKWKWYDLFMEERDLL